MKLLSILAAWMRPPADPDVVDHAPIKRPGNVAARKLAKARASKLEKDIAKASDRHGRQFHTHTNKARETEPSHYLQELQAKSAPKETIIVPNLDTRRKMK